TRNWPPGRTPPTPTSAKSAGSSPPRTPTPACATYIPNVSSDTPLGPITASLRPAGWDVVSGNQGRAVGGKRGALRSDRLDAGVVAAGVEEQCGDEQCGGGDGPQQQDGLLTAQAQVRPAR